MNPPITEPLYKKIEVVGTSDISIESAVNNAIALTSQSVRHLRWFEIDEIRGSLKDGQVDQWQVALKMAFTVDQKESANVQSQTVDNTGLSRETAKTPPVTGEKHRS